MTAHSITNTPADTPLPPDDPNRRLTVTSADDDGVNHIAMAGDTYTILVSGEQTDGRYCLVDMLIPNGGGPGPHRHDFEEMFTLLEGELEFGFRGQTTTVAAPHTVNIPANAPHVFKNVSGKTVRLLCMCTPAGQEEFFEAVATPVDSRTTPAPELTGDEQSAFFEKITELAPKYRTEMLESTAVIDG